jgi:signal transduction histidine kinase
VEVAYDSMMKRSINGIAINLDNQPTLTSAIERLEQRVILPDQNRDELEDLYTRLDIEQMGPAYFQPIKREGSLLGVLIVALPYTNRELSGPERELLKGVTVIAGGLLMLSDAAADASLLAEERAIQALVQGIAPGQVEAGEAVSAREELQNSLQLAREQIKQLSSQVLQLKVQLDEERGRIAADLGDTEDGLSISQQMVALVDEQQSLRQEREQLMQRLQEAETALQGVMTADDALMYRDMIEALQQERVELIGERERLQEELDTLRGGPLETPQDAQKLLERMNQERSELEQERDQYNAKLADLESQLEAFGLQAGTAGLTQLIFQLNEQRAMLQNQNAQLQSERDRLLQERSELADRIYHEEERKSQIEALQTQLQNIAGDREAVTRQRDQLRTAYSELERKVDDIKEHRTRLLAQASAYQMELQEAHQEQIALRQRIQELSNTRSDWASERDRLTAEKQAIENERDQLMARIEGDRQRLQELGTNGVGSLTSMIDDLTRQRSAMEHQLTEAQNKIAYLENELEAMEVLAEGVAPRYQPENPELMMSLVQDLRTPMTSIVGYVDLLMSESAGILGEMQRKFLRRVATNVTRLTMLLDDLVRVTELDTGQFALEYGSVDVVDLITDAIENASVQFREKGLTINLNLPDAVPDISGDQDAVEQIIGQLLTNAYLVSPPGSAITISAYRQEMVLTLPDDDEAAVDCVYISVEDRGGGIASEDQERVFARKYKADNPLIQGLGDTGVGLSVAKALVEAHGGRLWLETDENVGSIFSFVLPIKAIRVLEEMPDAS